MTTQRAPRPRADGLSRDRVVQVAVELLDSAGERGLTFRSLAARLQTGHGAIQWHVATKDQLLAVATVTVLTGALTAPAPGTPPRESVRAVGLAIYDAVGTHPWVARRLFDVPWQPAMARLWEQLGHPVEELGVPEDSLFTAVSTLLHYVVGVASQNARNAHVVAAGRRRDDVLGAVADEWEGLDPVEYPFVHRVAGQLLAHDDREEFLAGLDVILAGLVSSC